MKNFESIVLL